MVRRKATRYSYEELARAQARSGRTLAISILVLLMYNLLNANPNPYIALILIMAWGLVTILLEMQYQNNVDRSKMLDAHEVLDQL